MCIEVKLRHALGVGWCVDGNDGHCVRVTLTLCSA